MKEDRRAQTAMDILREINSCGTFTRLTCRDIEEFTGLRHQTASARISELVDMGIVRQDGSLPPFVQGNPRHGIFRMTPEGERLMSLPDPRDALVKVRAAYRIACEYRAEAMRKEKAAIAQEVRRMARAALAEVIR